MNTTNLEALTSLDRQAEALKLKPTPCQKLKVGRKWGFPKIRGTILGVPIIRTIVYWGLYWGPLNGFLKNPFLQRL